MASVNKVILIGNLTRDPELRYTPKQTAVTELGIAVNRRYRVDNDLREEVTFVDVTFWGQQAETVSKYLEKGRPIYIEGRLKLDSWDDKETGKRRSKLTVVGENFQFIDSRGSGGGGGSGPMGDSSRPAATMGGAAAASGPMASAPPPATGTGPLADDDEEDDIPF